MNERLSHVVWNNIECHYFISNDLIGIVLPLVYDLYLGCHRWASALEVPQACVHWSRSLANGLTHDDTRIDQQRGLKETGTLYAT